jgi:hypothetical protein
LEALGAPCHTFFIGDFDENGVRFVKLELKLLKEIKLVNITSHATPALLIELFEITKK